MNPFTTMLKINPGFSRRFFQILIVISFAAIVVIMSLELNVLVKMLVCLIILIWLRKVVREYCWHLDCAIQGGILRADDSWLISLVGEEPVKADLLPGSLVQPWLTVLQFRMPDRHRKSLILLQDNMDKDIFRRLRVRLKNIS